MCNMCPYEIEIDCPPGYTRPDDVLKTVLDGSPLTINDFILVSKCFGNWTFKLNADKEGEYVKHQLFIGSKLERAYRAGTIRYAAW
jgi:hypothetical protein